jgi:hypothetical protein
MCNNFLQQMEIDALEQLISEDVKVQGQIVHDGFRTCLMVLRIITRVVAGVVAGGDEVYQHHSSARSSLEDSALTSMRVDRFFLRVEEKTLPLHGGRRWSLLTWPLRTCTASSPRPMKNRPLPWSTNEDARGWRAGMAPLRHRRTTLSWRGWWKAQRKTDGDVAAEPPHCRTSP